jgi:hypothetical protein
MTPLTFVHYAGPMTIAFANGPMEDAYQVRTAWEGESNRARPIHEPFETICWPFQIKAYVNICLIPSGIRF